MNAWLYARLHRPSDPVLLRALGSFNPFWAQVHYWVELAKLSWRAPYLLDRLRVWWKPPSYRPRGLDAAPAQAVSAATFHKYDVPLSRAARAYLSVQYVLLIAGATALIFYAAQLPWPLVCASILVLLLGVLAVGALLERKWWAMPTEALRLVSTLALAITFLLV